MPVTFERTVFSGRRQAFWRGEAKMLPGGFKIANTFNVGAVIKRGAFACVDFDSMSAGVVKFGNVLKGGTTSAPRVAKDNYFEVGDVVSKLADSMTGVTVKSIDTSNSEYDVITLSSAITGLAEGDFMVEVSATGADATQKYTPNTVIGADKEIKKNGSQTLDVAYECVVIKDNVPSFPSSWLAENGFYMVNNPSIRFIRQ